jgi:ubiquinone/menaquinone biosynthesis C-methylase UbiE
MLAKHYTDTTPAAEETPAVLNSLNGRYALDNSAVEAGDRFAALSKLFDAGTIRHIEERGIAKGWHCLEVGGGGGSIAAWLSDRVGPAGRVVVTDINTHFLDSLERLNLEVRRHDIVTDPLPDGAFDLIHARLVLMHLPEREAVLTRLIKALKPGGWLLDEEFDVLSMYPDADLNRHEAVLSSFLALNRVLAERGVELRFGRFLYGQLRSLGMVEVGAQAQVSMGAGGSVVANLVRSNFCQLRDAMIQGGHITAEEIEDDLKRLDHPDSLILTPTMWSAWGHRPEGTDRRPDVSVFV